MENQVEIKKRKKKAYHKKWREENREDQNKKRKAYNIKWYKEHREYYKEYSKKWYEENKEVVKERNRKHMKEKYDNPEEKEKKKRVQKKYIATHRDEIRIRARKNYHKNSKDTIHKYMKKRRINDPLYKLRNNYSRSLRGQLKKRGTSKNGKSCMDFVSYTIQELKDHLENLFLPGMTWENYGKWHIDHRIPISFFNPQDQVELRMCWRLENLQPLWAKDNMVKGNRIINNLSAK